MGIDTGTVIAIMAIAAVALLTTIPLALSANRIPSSPYAISLRIACYLSPLCLAADIVYLGLSLSPSPSASSLRLASVLPSLILNVSVSAFTVADLLFLKTMGPYLTSLSPTTVTRIILVLLGISCLVTPAYICTAFGPYFAAPLQVRMSNAAVAYTTLLGLYNLCQRLGFLYIVMTRLKISRVSRRRYAAWIAASALTGTVGALAAVYIPLSVRVIRRPVLDIGVIMFGQCSVGCMETLRVALIERIKRKAKRVAQFHGGPSSGSRMRTIASAPMGGGGNEKPGSGSGARSAGAVAMLAASVGGEKSAAVSMGHNTRRGSMRPDTSVRRDSTNQLAQTVQQQQPQQSQTPQTTQTPQAPKKARQQVQMLHASHDFEVHILPDSSDAIVAGKTSDDGVLPSRVQQRGLGSSGSHGGESSSSRASMSAGLQNSSRGLMPPPPTASMAGQSSSPDQPARPKRTAVQRLQVSSLASPQSQSHSSRSLSLSAGSRSPR
ncbi:hypothetical protein BC831DRAFT_458516 [Entophlyctis helioformis]|nr:hypothetical protein BC831DRAFT_458516 [Entophlyctis helioformis]